MIDSMTAGEIANDWALACCETLERRDIEGHMNLISRQVKVDSDTQLRLTAIESLTDKDGHEHESPLLITLCKVPSARKRMASGAPLRRRS